MHAIATIFTMVLAVAISGYLSRILPRAIPLPFVQIVLGGLIPLIPQQGVDLEPDLFFLIFLPPLLFLDGWRIPKEGLLRDKTIIVQLAFGLVLFTVGGMGFFIHWLIPSMPLGVSFALAAILSPTDAVAVSSIAARTAMPARLLHILEGEALLNDASGLVCLRFAIAAVMTGTFSLASASLTFLWVAFGGLAIGAGVTWGVSLGHNQLSRRFGEAVGTPILVSLLTPFIAYAAAEAAGTSGILAVVAGGITMSRVELTGLTLATTRTARTAVWNTVQFALNGMMFVILGEQLPAIFRKATVTVEQTGHVNAWWLWVYVIVINVVLGLLRILWVWLSLQLNVWRAHRRGHPITQPGWQLIVATSFAGVRGAVTLASVLTIPLTLSNGTPFPARDLAIFLAAAVILASLLAASIGLPQLLRGLKFPEESHNVAQENLARAQGAKAALAAIEAAQHKLTETDSKNASIYVGAATRVMDVYERRIARDDPSETEASLLQKADQAERFLWLAALKAERGTIFQLARENRISDDVSRRLVTDIDLLEAHFH